MNIEIELNLDKSGLGLFKIDGKVVPEVKGVTIVDRVGEMPIVTVDLAPGEKGIIKGEADVRIMMGDKTYQLIEMGALLDH